MITTVQQKAPTPEEIERRIKDVGDRAMQLAAAGDSKAARACYVEMAGLVAMRSPETVARLERERGLR